MGDLPVGVGLFIVGLLLGSFIGSLAYRLPRIWYLVPNPSAVGLFRPRRSFCPHCNNSLSVAQLVPLWGFCRHLGVSSCCKKPISPLYPLGELLAALLLFGAWWLYGFSLTAGLLVFFGLWCLLLSLIDARYFLLPDRLTLVGLWLGLLVHSFWGMVPLSEAIWGASLGYGLLFVLRWVHFLWRKQEGLGLGDAKFVAMLGAWCGVFALDDILLVASVAALVGFLCVALYERRFESTKPLPFGPFLSLGGVVSFASVL